MSSSIPLNEFFQFQHYLEGRQAIDVMELLGKQKGFGKPTLNNSRHLVETQLHPAAAELEIEKQEE